MRCSSRLLVAGLIVAGAHVAHAQIEVGVFHNPGDSGDVFGEEIVQDGELVYISAVLADAGQGVDAGAVYVYHVNSPLIVINTLTPSDGRNSDCFGDALAVDGVRVAVGALDGQSAGVESGAAYVFNTSTGGQVKLIPEDLNPGMDFGASVAICGNTVFVGAPLDDRAMSPFSDEGSVYVFDATTGMQLNKFWAPASADGAQFGRSMTKRGGVLLIGAPGENFTGAAHTFDATTQEHLETFESDDPLPFSGFGQAVALSGFAALIGAPLAANGDETGAGSVSAFDPKTATPAHYTLNAETEGDDFGRSIAVDESGSRGAASLAVIGAPGDDEAASGAGAAYVINAMSGDIITKLTAGDAQLFDLFGSAVSISGRYVVVGAPNEDTNGNNSGAAYLFLLDPPCPADLAEPFGVLDFSDVFAFLVAFGAMDPAADLAEPFGGFDFSDVFAFLTSFGGGCP